MTKIVNLGSLCVDHVYQVPDLVRAGETTASTKHQIFAGGKGLNQSLAAALAGAQVVQAGAVGEDGGFLIEQLAAAGVNTALVQRQSGNSGHAVIQVNAQGHNAIVIAGGCNRTLPQSLFQQAINLLQPGDWLLLQNEINDLDSILALADSARAQVAFNVAPVDGREAGYNLHSVALLVVNEVEILALAPQATSPQLALAQLHQQLPNTEIVLTLGNAGLLYAPSKANKVEQHNSVLQLPAHSVQAVDETAAGDAFIGHLLAAQAEGLPMLTALQRASAAGALAVTQAGAAPSLPTAAQVTEFMAANPPLVA